MLFVFNLSQCLIEVLEGNFGEKFSDVDVEFEANDDERTELLFGMEFRQHFRHKVGCEFVWVEDFLSGGEGGDEEDSKGSIDSNFLGVNDDDAFDIDFEFNSDFRNLKLRKKVRPIF